MHNVGTCWFLVNKTCKHAALHKNRYSTVYLLYTSASDHSINKHRVQLCKSRFRASVASQVGNTSCYKFT